MFWKVPTAKVTLLYDSEKAAVHKVESHKVLFPAVLKTLSNHHGLQYRILLSYLQRFHVLFLAIGSESGYWYQLIGPEIETGCLVEPVEENSPWTTYGSQALPTLSSEIPQSFTWSNSW